MNNNLHMVRAQITTRPSQEHIEAAKEKAKQNELRENGRMVYPDVNHY